MKSVPSSSRKSRKRSHPALRRLDFLESRTLLSATPVTPYAIPAVTPALSVYDKNNNLWVYNTSYSYVTDPADPINSTVYCPALQRVSNGNVDPSSTILLSTAAPASLVLGPNGHIYATDQSAVNPDTYAYGAIDDIDLATGTVVQTFIPITGDSFQSEPLSLTVTNDGNVWFSTMGKAISTTTHANFIGVMNPSTHNIITSSLPDNLGDSVTSFVTPNDDHSIWLALPAYETGSVGFDPFFGTNRVATVSFNGSSFNVTPYTVNTGSAADYNNVVQGLASDGQGGLWFTLSNLNAGTHSNPGSAPDQFVHASLVNGQLQQTAYIDPSVDPNVPAQYSNLVIDKSGALWTVAFNTQQIVSFDPNTFDSANPAPAFTSYKNTFYPEPTYTSDDIFSPAVYYVSVNPAGDQVTAITVAGDYSIGWPIFQFDITTPEPPAITFQGAATNIHAKEDSSVASALNGTPLAVFLAPTPVSNYSAVITWGDGSTSTVAVIDLGSNSYALYAPNKSFATQGTYAGSIAIKDGTTTAGTLSFSSSISDIPLNVSSFNVTPLILRIAAATGTFTDDADLSVSTWTATITWGDNTSSQAVIVRDPTQAGRYIIIGLHQYRTRGTYTARLTVKTSESNAAILNSSLTTSVSVR